jgi:hypothetical protein
MAGPPTAVRRPPPARRLAPPWRKLLLTVHVGTSVGLLGADATLVLLGLAGAGGADPRTVYPAMHLLGTGLLVPLAVASLASGVLLGVLTPWGLTRHWWVLAKLALTTAGTVLALTVLTPALTAAAEVTRAGVLPSDAQREALVRDPGAASVVLLITLVLSVYKPWGRVRGR